MFIFTFSIRLQLHHVLGAEKSVRAWSIFTVLGTEEMIQWVKHFPHKHEDLSFPEPPQRQLRQQHVYTPSSPPVRW